MDRLKDELAFRDILPGRDQEADQRGNTAGFGAAGINTGIIHKHTGRSLQTISLLMFIRSDFLPKPILAQLDFFDRKLDFS